MTPEDLTKLPLLLERRFYDLQDRIMADVVRRILKTSEITSTADYQLLKMQMLGETTEFIESEIKRLTDLTDADIWELYDEVIDKDYTRYKDIYEQINSNFIPYEENEILQSWVTGAVKQTKGEIENISQSLGFAVDMGAGKKVFTPLAHYYQKYVDKACLDIVTGSFDYNTALKRTVKEMSASGLQVVEYASGHRNRAPVAARRAVLTGVNQLSAKINDHVGKQLGTEYFEVTAHAGARPSHADWQGRVYKREDLVSICGLGEVTGLCGANCRHNYYAFVPGVSERAYSDEDLAEIKAEDEIIRTYNGVKYNRYEANQRQRQYETTMRAQRANIKQLKRGRADKDTVEAAQTRYLNTMREYKEFSKATKLPTQMERVYIDGLGRVVPGDTRAVTSKFTEEMLKNYKRDRKQHETFKNVIGKDAGTIEQFRNMKYNKPKEFWLLEGYKKAVDAGDIHVFVGFDLYKETAEQIEKELVGTVAKDNYTVNSYTTHFVDRVIGQVADNHPGKRKGVPVSLVKDALINPEEISPQVVLNSGEIRQRYIAKKASVVFSVTDSRLIQCNPLGG